MGENLKKIALWAGNILFLILYHPGKNYLYASCCAINLNQEIENIICEPILVESEAGRPVCSHLFIKMSPIPSVQDWTNLIIRYSSMLLFTIVIHLRKWAWEAKEIWTYVNRLHTLHCTKFKYYATNFLLQNYWIDTSPWPCSGRFLILSHLTEQHNTIIVIKHGAGIELKTPGFSAPAYLELGKARACIVLRSTRPHKIKN